MISLPAAVRAFLCTRSVELRRNFDGLSGLVEECFRKAPRTTHLFLFVNRRRDRIKVRYFDPIRGILAWREELRY